MTLTSLEAGLTTQQAADVLNVSCQHIVALLETGQIPYFRVGSDLRIRETDLAAYQANDRTEREAALDELTAEAQKLGLGY